MVRRHGITLALLFLAVEARAASVGQVEGTVVDASDGTPLVGAVVVLHGTTLGMVTDSDGDFLFERAPTGEITVTASMVGYRPASVTVIVTENDTTRLTLSLTATVIEGKPLIVTASRRLQELRDSPTAMNIVTPEDIIGRNVGTPLGALEYVPGTTIIGSQVSIRGSSGFTQGAGSRVGVLVDGISVLTGDVGDVKWELIPPEVIDRVELAKGASSALYGSGALGGVINQITRQPGERPETRLRLTGGWYAGLEDYVAPPGRLYHATFAVTHTQRVGLTSVLTNIRREKDTGARAGADNTRYNLFLKLERPWSLTTDFGLMGIYSHENHGNTLQSYPDSLHYTRTNGSRVIGPDQFASFWVRQMHGSRLTLKVTAHLYRSAFDEVSATLEPVTSSDAITGGVEGQATWVPFPRLTFIGGFSTERSWIDAELFQGKRLTDLGLFAQAEIGPLSFATLTAGLHYDRRSSDASPARGQVSPRVGLVLSPTRTTALRGLLSKGFRGPTISELSTYRDEGDLAIRPNSALKPERTWSIESGISQTFGRFATLDFSAFESRYEDMIEPTVQDTTDPTTGKLVVVFENVLSARVRGFEAAGKVAFFGDRVQLQGSYMFLDTRNRSPENTRNAAGADSLRLPYRPRHTVRTGVELRYGAHFAGYDYRYISSYPVTVYPSDPRVAQIVSDARLGTRWRSLRLTLSVTNLFNYVYAPRERKMSDPRRYAISVETAF